MQDSPIGFQLNLAIPVKRESLQCENEDFRQLLEAISAQSISFNFTCFALPLLRPFKKVILDITVEKGV